MIRMITPPLAGLATCLAIAVAPLMTSAAETSARPPTSASDQAVVYEGRTAVEPSGAVRLGFPGVTAHLRFHASGLSLQAEASSDGVYFDVSLDGAPPALLHLKKGDGSYPLVQGAAATDHTLELTRRTESWEGVCTLESFALAPGGDWLTPLVLPARKLMFIGDSVTCGEFAAWKPGDSLENQAILTDAQVSYGMLLVRRLGAQCHLVSYGGRGIIRDWQGIRNTNNAPEFYELALPDDPATHWDHSRYVPDAIGIQLGTNDFGSGVPDETEFVKAYVEFLRKIRRDAPQAWIVIMDSPILNDDASGPKHSMLHAYLEKVAQIVRDDRVVVATIKRYPGVPGNGHPTGEEHAAMADELEPVFRKLLGW